MKKYIIPLLICILIFNTQTKAEAGIISIGIRAVKWTITLIVKSVKSERRLVFFLNKKGAANLFKFGKPKNWQEFIVRAKPRELRAAKNTLQATYSRLRQSNPTQAKIIKRIISDIDKKLYPIPKAAK